MFLPLYDGVKRRFVERPIGNITLIAVTIAIFVAEQVEFSEWIDRLNLAFGVIPSVLWGFATLSPDIQVVSEPVTLLTSVFFHASYAHLFGNMLFLWVFGDIVEDAMGTVHYVLFYSLCGMSAALIYSIAQSQSEDPLIGASGAISGVIAACVLLYPRAKILGLLFFWVPLQIPAFFFLYVWVAFQLFMSFASPGQTIGWWDHIGGLVTGGLLVIFMRRRYVPLLGLRQR